MSFSDYSSLQNSVTAFMARTDLTSVIPDFITLFETEANRNLRCRQQMVTQATTPSTPNGLGTFPLPSDYLEWEALIWTGNPARNLQYVDPSYITDRYPDSPGAIPAVFTVYGTTDSTGYVQIMPTDGGVLDFTYYQKVTPLSTSNTSNWLLAAHPDVYLAGAMTEACVYTKEYDTAAVWKGRRDTLLQEIQRLNEKTRGPAYIRVPGRNP